MKIHYAAALLAMGLAVGSANAEFNVLDNFNSYATGTDLSTGGVGGWSTGGGGGAILGNATIQLDPAGASGNVLQLFSANPSPAATVFKTAPSIARGATPATVFFRMRASFDAALHEVGGGMTDQTAPDSFSGSRSWTLFSNDDAPAVHAPNKFSIGSYDGAVALYHRPFEGDENTWYKIWEVFHNDDSGVNGGTYDVYIQGGAFATQTLVYAGNSFRATGGLLPVAGPLTTWVMISDDAGPNFIDDIYVDTGSANLNDPTAAAIPEPAAISLLGLGLAGLLIRRRAH